MASRPKAPDLRSDIDRNITVPFVLPTSDNLSVNEFIEKVKKSGQQLYGKPELPLFNNLTIAHKEDKITATTQVLVNMIGVSAKGKMLRDLIDNAQKQIAEKSELYIPVIGSPDCQKAIARTFPKSSPNNDRIYWNMWVDVVKAKIRQGDVIGSQLLEQLTGNSPQDSQILQETLNANEIRRSEEVNARNQNFSSNGGGAGPAPLDYGKLLTESESSDNTQVLLELLAYGASLVLLYFLQKRLKIWAAPDDHVLAESSTLTPSPVGVSVMLIQILVGLIIHFILEGLFAPDAKRVIDGMQFPGVSDKDKEDAIQAAIDLASGNVATVGPWQGKDINDPEVQKALGLKDGVLDAIKSYFYRADYDVIYEYGLSWLSANANAIHIKGDFSQWLVLPELESMIYTMDNTIAEAPNYSVPFKENADQIGLKPSVSQPVSTALDAEYNDFMKALYTKSVKSSDIDLGAFGSFSTTAAIDDLKNRFEPHDMVDALLNNMHSQNCKYNDVLNRLAGFLTHDPFIAAAVCCFVRYFGAVDLKLLHAIRAILQIFARGVIFDLGNFLNTISSNIYDDIFNKARSSLMAQLNRMFQSIFKEVMSWMDTEALDILEDCLPIDGLIKFTATAMLDMKASLDALIAEYLKNGEIQVLTLDSKISILAEQRWAKTLYAIVDALIIVGAEGNNCRLTGDPLSDLPTKALIESLLNNPPRQQDSIFYNSLVTEVDSNSNSGLNTNTGIGSGNRLEGLILTKTIRYTPRIVNSDLLTLMDEPTVFNTFQDNEGFVTQNGIKVDSIIKNLNNKESFKMTVDSAVTPANIESCFASIDQSKLLKHVFGNLNGQR